MNNLRSLRKNAGLSLVEVMWVACIFIAILGIIYASYLSGLDIWQISRDQADLQAQARLALKYMTSELRNATRTSSQNPTPNLSIPSEPNNKQIHFYLPADKDNNGLIIDAFGQIEWDTNNKIDYQFIPGQDILRRLHKGEQKTIARNVSDVQFIDINIDHSLAINELKIILSLTKTTEKKRTISMTLSSVVALRN